MDCYKILVINSILLESLVLIEDLLSNAFLQSAEFLHVDMVQVGVDVVCDVFEQKYNQYLYLGSFDIRLVQ